jgi:ubiquinone/menaquinone biosynthesis C-methylase UbiE
MIRRDSPGALFDELDEYWEEIVDARPTELEVDFIQRVLEKGLILDLCCGTGRHSIVLAERGKKVVGLDYSPNLLRVAKNSMAEKGVAIPIVRAEMRHLPFQPKVFAAAVSMFTSLGYLASETEDVESFKEVARVLKEEGLFLVDVMNRKHLLQSFKKKDWGEYPRFYMLEKRTLDEKASRLHSKWVLIEKASGETRIFDHNLRLYTLAQLRAMLKESGLTLTAVYGDYEGHALERRSPRLIILARRKA